MITPTDLLCDSPYLKKVSKYANWSALNTYVCTRKYWPKLDIMNWAPGGLI